MVVFNISMVSTFSLISKDAVPEQNADSGLRKRFRLSSVDFDKIKVRTELAADEIEAKASFSVAVEDRCEAKISEAKIAIDENESSNSS